MTIGKIESFDLLSRKWSIYVNRVKQFIALNEVKESLRVATLVTVVGEATYDLMCDLCAPASPEDKSFDELVAIVKNHLEPRRSEIAERHIFRQRRQRTGEELNIYLQHLKHLASTCNFAEKLEENLRDQFVSGLDSDEMRSRLFAEMDLDYKKAVELALALEAAERHAVASAGSGGGGAGQVGSSGASADSAVDGTGAVHRIGAAAAGRRPRDQQPPRRPCWRCGKPHPSDRCRFKQFNCNSCGSRGHIQAQCESVRQYNKNISASKRNQFYIEMDSEDDSEFYNICVDGAGDKPYVVKIFVDNIPIAFEVDTGSKISAINEQLFQSYFKNYELMKSNLRLRTYNGGRIEPLGVISVCIRYEGCGGAGREARALPLYVIPGGGPPLLGREWLRALNLSNISIRLNHLRNNYTGTADDTRTIVDRLSKEFPYVFADGLGTCKVRFTLKLKDNEPIFHKARNLPLALREPVEKELDRLVKEGTIVKVENADYGTPIVPVIKKCGSVRICGDYKVTINPKIRREPYPLPRIEELFANLSGGKIFSKIDLAHAFEQVILSEDSRACTTISTHVGTFQYIRTPYGISCIPEKFQKMMDEIMRGVPNTVVFCDDICVSGVSHEDHLNNLREVFRCLQAAGLRVKLEKCDFLKSSVCYLGHIIDRDRLHPDPRKVKAISDAPRPTDIHQLKAFLGLVNYYGKFIPQMSGILHPMYELLKKDNEWNWKNECERAFCKIKNMLCSDQLLAHYDPKLPLVLSVDSSAYGLGAILAHRYPDGSERPICCVSRTLNSAEKSYSQLDKEALATFFGITKNHQYLYGRRFVLRTDHKPLSYIFGDKVGIPQTAASRLQRYAARLAAYDFTVQWVSSARNAAADCLSRLPLERNTGATPDPGVSYLNFIENELPISRKDVADATKIDPIMRKIYNYIVCGWPGDTDVQQEKPYFYRKDNLFVDSGCIFYNYRVVVPPTFRKKILKELHEGHLGIVKMKSIARNYVYWPNIDTEIEEMCRACDVCMQQRAAPPHAPLTPWPFPAGPWQRLHADFAECDRRHYLIVVDAHSKWIEVFMMNSTAARPVILKFREMFARFGLPQRVVTDNGPPFASSEVKTYFVKNGIQHSLVSPYRAKGNGAAEISVKMVKNCIKKARTEGVEVEQALSKMLFQYRNCEQATTGVAPAVALLGRRLRSRLDLLRGPDAAERVQANQRAQIERSGGTPRRVSVGDTVFVRDYSRVNKNKWVEGRVTDKVGPSSYAVEMPRGATRRHIDQILGPKEAKPNRFSLSRISNIDTAKGERPSSTTFVENNPTYDDETSVMETPNDKSNCNVDRSDVTEDEQRGCDHEQSQTDTEDTEPETTGDGSEESVETDLSESDHEASGTVATAAAPAASDHEDTDNTPSFSSRLFEFVNMRPRNNRPNYDNYD